MEGALRLPGAGVQGRVRALHWDVGEGAGVALRAASSMDLFLRISENPLDSVQQERNWSSFHSSVALGGEWIHREEDRAHGATKASS